MADTIEFIKILFQSTLKVLILLENVFNARVFSLTGECLMYDAFLSEILRKHAEFRSTDRS